MTAPPSGLGRLSSLLGALDPQGPPPSPREIAELIWLGQHLPQDMTSGSWDGPGPVGREDAASPDPGQDGDSTSATAEAADSSDRLYLPEGGRPSSTPHAGLRAAALRVTGAAALPRRRALTRALRPLKRRVPSTARTVLDEDATADAVARDGRWLPYLVPAEERWLDVQLIIDADSDCADLWSPIGRDLRRTLQELGAFRDVRSYWLHRQDDGHPRLAGGPAAAGPLRSAAAAIDPTGRTLTLVLTDGVAAWWQSANLRTALLRWATTGPTALLQTLPDHLWERTALAPSPGRFHNTGPGAPNSWLHFTPYALGARPAQPDEVPVPVLGIEPDWLAPWAHSLSATGAFDGAAVILRPGPAGSQIPAGSAAVPRRQQVSFEDFLAQTDPRVFQLAAYLSAAPLNLPVMRLIQAAMLPESPPSDLAEIVFGGLLHKVTADSTDALHPAYDFAPAIRNRLRSTLRRDEADAVLAAVSAHIRNHTSSTTRFTAAVPDQEGPLVLPPEARHWAQVRSDVLRRHGQPAPAPDEPAYQGEDAVAPATKTAAGETPSQPTLTATAVIVTGHKREYRTVRSQLTGLEAITLPSGVDMEKGRLAGTPWEVAIITLEPGTGGIVPQFIANELRPRLMLSVGLAEALQPDMEIGELVIAETVYGYDDDRSRALHPSRRRAWRGSHELFQTCLTLLRDMPKLRYRLRPIVAAHTLPSSMASVKDIQLTYRDACAVDSHAPIYDTASDGEMECLVIRAISGRAGTKERMSAESRVHNTLAMRTTRVAIDLLRYHHPHKIRPSTSADLLQADVPWEKFDPTAHVDQEAHTTPGPSEYFTQGPAAPGPTELKSLEQIRDHFSSHFRSKNAEFRGPCDGFSVGAGSSILPALIMLPWCETITLLEHSEQNRRSLRSQLRGYASEWDPYWEILCDREEYAHLPADPRIRFSENVQILRGDLSDLTISPSRWGAGIIFFEINPISTWHDNFPNIVTGFMNALHPGSPFAVTITMTSVSRAGEEYVHDTFARLADTVNFSVFPDTRSSKRERAATVLIVCGRAPLTETGPASPAQ